MSQPIIKLKSDFHDFYDHWFAGSGQCATHEFERLTTGGMSRREMLAWFDEAGFSSPRRQHAMFQNTHCSQLIM